MNSLIRFFTLRFDRTFSVVSNMLERHVERYREEKILTQKTIVSDFGSTYFYMFI